MRYVLRAARFGFAAIAFGLRATERACTRPLQPAAAAL